MDKDKILKKLQEKSVSSEAYIEVADKQYKETEAILEKALLQRHQAFVQAKDDKSFLELVNALFKKKVDVAAQNCGGSFSNSDLQEIFVPVVKSLSVRQQKKLRTLLDSRIMYLEERKEELAKKATDEFLELYIREMHEEMRDEVALEIDNIKKLLSLF